jgi:hypothetical protein
VEKSEISKENIKRNHHIILALQQNQPLDLKYQHKSFITFLLSNLIWLDNHGSRRKNLI